MKKYKVLKPFMNYETEECYKVGQEVELTEKRSDEIIENLEKWGGGFLEEVKESKKTPAKKEEPPTE